VSGLFFGAVPTLIAMAMTAAYRLYAGGSGVLMGVAVVISSGGIGLLWRRFFPPRSIKKPALNLLALGFFVHLAMMACTFLLPRDIYWETLRNIMLPLYLIYTPGTMLLGLLMMRHWSIWQTQRDKEEIMRKYRQLIENAGEGIIVAQESYIRFLNPRMCDILGYDEREILSNPFTVFVHPDDRGIALQRHIDRITGVGMPRNYSFRIITKSGETRWLEINSARIEWEGRPATLNFINDVTSSRETERQLKIAKEKAEESDRLKSIFLSNMSHEIRTPMNAILGFSDLLADDGTGPEQQRRYLDMIRLSGRKLLRIINDIVDISKLDAGQLTLHRKTFRLYDIFAESVKVFRDSTVYRHKSDVELRLNFPRDMQDVYVRSDPHRLQQVLDNLLDNAIKYTERGVIEAGCDCSGKKGLLMLRGYVRDTGPGIPEDKAGVIFERFRQVEEEGFHEGAGLGLSICRGIVELLGGRIWVESDPGKGSCFYFSVPLETAEDPRAEENGKKTAVPDLRNKRILVAEDDLSSYSLICAYLRDSGAAVNHAPDGVVLMDMLAEGLPDLLLLDINLPGKDGYRCMEEIREKGYELKIIAQTAYAMQDEKKRCLASGCDGYVAKPFDRETLFQEIDRVMMPDDHSKRSK
jgi:hypothetical protein